MTARLLQALGRCTRTIAYKPITMPGIMSQSLPIYYKCSNLRFYGSVYEPEYLSQLVPEIPTYDILNVQMKGYDFTILEHYAKYVLKTANHMDVEVEDSWATPGRVLKIQSYSPGAVVTEKEYHLTLHERNIQVTNVPSITLPLFIEVLQNSLPEGVQLVVHPHKEEHETERYIPDLELKALRQELDDIGNPLAKKKKSSLL